MKQRGPVVVLVVDADEGYRGLYLATLTLAGFHCLASATPEEAIRLAGRIPFDVIVMDLAQPQLADGLALAWHLGAVPDPPPLIAVSGYRVPTAPSAFRLLLWKPVDPDDLVRYVGRIAGERSGPRSVPRQRQVGTD